MNAKALKDSSECLEVRMMSNRSKATFHEGGIIFDPRKIAEPTPIRMGEAIETLEGLRDTVAAQHWANPSAQHSVLYGIKMCIHVLKQKPNEITE